MLTDLKGEKIIRKLRKCIKYNDISTKEGHYNAMHDKYMCNIEYTGGAPEQLTAKTIYKKFYHKLNLKGTIIKC